MRTTLLTFLLAALLFSPAFADIVEQGLGTVSGDDYAFTLKAPPGWVLDSESGVDQGMRAVFYPKGANWKDSAVVAYARTRRKTAEIATAEDVAKSVVADFHTQGMPTYKAQRVKLIKSNAGQDAVIYYFTGDKWGDSEAAAYYVEKKTINFVMFSARDPKVFASAFGSFETLVRSYVFLGDHAADTLRPASTPKPEESTPQFADFSSRAHTMGETPEGRDYEKSFSKAFAKPMQTALHECTKDLKPPYYVDLIFEIAANGTAQRVLSAPGQTLSARIARKLDGQQLPPPPKADWLVAVSLSVNE